jgi:ubiquinone/menaquinone biosynthesis C-methylase UbiE
MSPAAASTGRVHHPLFARFFLRAVPAMDRGGMAEHRRTLLADAAGDVVEVGAGSGANFLHYPATVARVTAVEPEPTLRKAAQRSAAEASVPIEVVDGLAERLPLPDACADTVVVTMVLCSVRDQNEALAQLLRVLKPGGRLHFLEHGRADSPGMRRVQRIIDAGVNPLLLGGCHTGRDTAAAIEQAGFTVTRLERFLWPKARLPHAFHMKGVAQRPQS